MKTLTTANQLEMVMLVFKIRKIRLLQSAPKKVLKSCEQIRLFEIVEEKLLSIPNLDYQYQLFCIDLFYQMSRIWEAYSRDKNGNIRFQFYQKSCVKEEIIKNFNNFVSVFQRPIQFTNYDNQRALQFAKTNLLENIKTLSFIYQQKITNDQIENFFDQVKILQINQCYIGYFAFCSQISTRVYVQFIIGQYFVIAVLVESFYYWLMKNQDPLVILSEGQNRFYIKKDLYEPGDYYNKIVNKLEIWYPSPFRMQIKCLDIF